MNKWLIGFLVAFIGLDIVLFGYYYFNNKKPTNQQSTSQVTSVGTSPKVVDEKLTVTSDIPGITVQFTDKQFLENYLSQKEIYGFRTVYIVDGKIPRANVQYLTYHLTNSYPDHIIQGQEAELNGSLITSGAYGLQYNSKKEKLDVLIYINPDFMKKYDLSQVFSTEILAATDILKDPMGPYDGKSDLKDVVGKLSSLSNKSFVTVSQ